MPSRSVASKLLGKRNLPPLPARCEWLFRTAEVPENELVACTCWEYLREVRPGDLSDGRLATYAQHLLISYRNEPERRHFNDSFERIPLRVFFCLADRPDQPLPLPPWQRLGEELRAELIQPLPPGWNPLIKLDVTATSLTSWELKMPLPTRSARLESWTDQAAQLYAFAIAHEARHLATGELREASLKDEAAPRSEKFVNDGVPADDPRRWLLPYAANGFAAPAPFLINWAEYTKEEIVRAFEQWIQDAPPGFTPRGRQRGTKASDLRGPLRDLGAMRIMRAVTAEEFTGWYPDEYDLLRQPRRGRKLRKEPTLDLIKMRGNAVTFFQTHFAVDRTMKPQSWQPRRTKGHRLAPPTGDLPEIPTR